MPSLRQSSGYDGSQADGGGAAFVGAGLGAGFATGRGFGLGFGFGFGAAVVRVAVGGAAEIVGGGGELGAAVVAGAVVTATPAAGSWKDLFDGSDGAHAARQTTPAAATATRSAVGRAARSPKRTRFMERTAPVSIPAALVRTADPPNGSSGTVRVLRLFRSRIG